MVAVGVALHSANVYIASAALPSVAADIGGLSLYAWATTVFVFAAVLGSTAVATVLGRAGMRRAYRLAIGSVGVGTVIAALAPAMPVLLAGRFVQGLGGGLLFALAYSLVRLMLDRALWPYAMSLISAMWGVGTFAGPALGGTFAELGAWRLAFWTLVPVTLVFALWGGARLPRDGGRQRRPAPPPLAGVGLLGVSVLVLSAASVSARPLVNVGGIAAAALLFALWLAHERRTARRLLPAATFAPDGRLRWLYVAMALLMLAIAPEVFIAYFGQELQGLSPLAAGYLGTALAFGWSAASLATGGSARRGLLLFGSPLVTATGLLLLVPVGPLHHGGAAVIAAIALGYALVGWGVGTAWPQLVTGVLSTVPAGEQELAGVSITTIQLAATAAGAAIGGAIVNLAGFTDPGGVAGAHSAARALYLATLAVPPLVLAALAVQRRRARAAERRERAAGGRGAEAAA